MIVILSGVPGDITYYIEGLITNRSMIMIMNPGEFFCLSSALKHPGDLDTKNQKIQNGIKSCVLCFW